jgi:hypothetical protein
VPAATAAAAGTIVIGARALPVWQDEQTGGVNAGNIVIGMDACEVLEYSTCNIVIGTRAMASVVGGVGSAPQNNVIVGMEALEEPTGRTTETVIIGMRACIGDAGDGGAFNSDVIIGYRACADDSSANVTSSVVIGWQAGLIMGAVASSTSVVIGNAAIQTASGIDTCVAIGASTDLTNNADNSTVVGFASHGGLDNNTILGASAPNNGTSIVAPGSRNIIIGDGAGGSIVAGGNDNFALETFVGGTRRAMFFGNLDSGNIVIGNSTIAQRDLGTIGGTNQVKLINGTRGAGNPTNGGFFYVLAGALRWVGSAGTDTVIAPA